MPEAPAGPRAGVAPPPARHRTAERRGGERGADGSSSELEIDRARGRDGGVVGAVEALAAIAIDEDRPALAREIDAGERAGAAVGDPQRTVRAEREAVRARLADQLRIDAGGA